MALFDLTDFEWSVIRPLLPNKSRGVARVDDRRVLNGIFWRLRTPWADIPLRYGPHTTCVNRFNRCTARLQHRQMAITGQQTSRKSSDTPSPPVAITKPKIGFVTSLVTQWPFYGCRSVMSVVRASY